jgi:DNA-binding NarL/FixJ family response regulator
MPQRLILVSQCEVLARGLEAVLSSDFALIAAVPSLAQAPAASAQLAPDLILIEFDGSVTYQALCDLREVTKAHLILWVREIPPAFAFQAMQLGVRGVLRKQLGPELVLRCLEKVAAGELWFEEKLTSSFFRSERIPVTRREGQLIQLIGRGMKNKAIATELLISEGTVKVYLSNLFRKLGVNDRFELALYALQNLGESSAPIRTSERKGEGFRTVVIDRKAA